MWDPAAIERGRAFLRAERSAPPLIVPDGDADGLSSGAIVWHLLARLGATPQVVHPGKGEHVHTEAVREAIRARAPGAVIVLDQGSRAEPVDLAAPCLIVDHHVPVRGLPPDALVVRSSGDLSTSWLTFALCDGVAPIDDLAWLAALGAVGDLGADAPLPGLKELLRHLGKKNVTESVALLNAPRRSSAHDVATAWKVLIEARSPAQIARGEIEGVDLLRERRAEVAAEANRCSRVAPIVRGGVALIAFHSGAKVHPLVATRWKRRLKDQVVIAANYGYLPGRVNFAMRSEAKIDLIAFLHGLGVPLPGDAGYGHAAATGGSLPFPLFEQLLASLGLQPPDLHPM